MWVKPFKMRIAALSLLLTTFFYTLKSQTTTSEAPQVLAITVYFDFGQSAISTTADSILQAFVAELPANLDSIMVTAHTDAIGSLGANQQLSQLRAAAVETALIQKNIADSLIKINTFGEQAPIATNASEAGRQQNRRATLVAYGQSEGTYFSEPVLDTIAKPDVNYFYGQVLDPATEKGLVADVILRSETVTDSVRTDSLGRFQLQAPEVGKVEVDIFAEGYFFETVNKNMEDVENTRGIYKLKKVESGATIQLKYLFFMGGQAVLIQASKPQLAKILRFMQQNPTAEVEIGGHVNRPNEPRIAMDDESFILSVDRAKMVYDYLAENGISEDRMTYQGYGNWEMQFPRARTDAEQAANRRVELKIIDIK